MLPWAIRKTRKCIETLFSQLCDQFMIRRNYAKSFKGFATRIVVKLTALTTIQWINYLENRNINNLKIKIAQPCFEGWFLKNCLFLCLYFIWLLSFSLFPQMIYGDGHGSAIELFLNNLISFNLLLHSA